MLTIYGVPVSVHTRKVLVTARLKGLAFENEPVLPFDPPAGWAALSPTGLIPALRHDDFTCFDSQAIAVYLERLAPDPALIPADPREEARALALEHYAGAVLFARLVRPLFHEKVIRPGILNEGPPDETEIARLRDEVAPGIFGFLEAALAGRSRLAGGATGLADIAVACNLVNFRYLGLPLDAAAYPGLDRLFTQVIAEPAFAAALAAERPFVERLGLDAGFLA